MTEQRAAVNLAGRALPVLALAAILVGTSAVRRWAAKWGATTAEAGMTLPGDDLLPGADLVATRAITIHAPVSEVWPWIAQLGQDRAGFYSYDFLENLVGCNIHSAVRIEPRWQSVAVGQDFKLHPDMSMVIAAVQPESSMVVRGAIPVGDSPPPFDFTWAFVLVEAPDHTTRLLSRERYLYTRPWAPLLIEPTQVVSAVMSRKMFHGIKSRVELSTK